MRLNPYLFFNGNCEEAFNVYAKLLGGKIEMMMAHKGSPAEAHVAPEWATRSCMRGSAVGDQVLMASDAPPDRADGR
jgi:PhnB protein